MTIHSWLVSVTGLPGSNIWAAYPVHGHEPNLETTDCVTYFESSVEPDKLKARSVTIVDDENVSLERASQSRVTLRVRAFGPNRHRTAALIDDGGGADSDGHRELWPDVFQYVLTPIRPVYEPRDNGWLVYLTLDVLLLRTEAINRQLPRILSATATGTIDGDGVEVIDNG